MHGVTQRCVLLSLLCPFCVAATSPRRCRSPAGLCLAKQSGLQQSDVVDVVKLGAIACPMFALKVG